MPARRCGERGERGWARVRVTAHVHVRRACKGSLIGDAHIVDDQDLSLYERERQLNRHPILWPYLRLRRAHLKYAA